MPNFRDKTRANNAKQNWQRQRELIQKMRKVAPMKDATGRELKRGQIVHIPTTAVPSPVMVGEIVDIIEAGRITRPGQPPLPPRIIISATHMMGPDPLGTVHNVYVVGEKKLREVPAETPADSPEKQIEGVAKEDPLDTSTTSPPLASEEPPADIADIVLTDKE